MAIGKRLRYEILRRDNHTCRYCGASAPDVELEVDHVVPRTLGGTDEASNLVTSCVACNAGKSSVPPNAELVDDVDQDALRWSEAMRKASEIQRRRRDEVDELVEEFQSRWEGIWYPIESWVEHHPDRGWHYKKDPERKYPYVIEHYHSETEEQWYGELFDTLEEAENYIAQVCKRHIPPRPKDWARSVRQWIASGLTPDDFGALVDEVKEDRDYIAWDRKWAYTAGCCWGAIRERQAVARALLNAQEAPARGDA